VKLLFHLMRADVRRFRMLLGVWVLLQILDTIFTGVRPVLASDARLVTLVELMATILFLTRWLGLILIVALVVQAHPLVGSEAFWMTRPIPWHALFASKIVLLGTTVVAVPVLCEIVLMVACQVPAAEIARVALQTALFQTLWLLIVMGLSAATRNLARFALAAGGVLVGFALLINIAIAVLIRDMPGGPQLTVVTGRSVSSPTAGIVVLLLLIIAAVLQLAVQYRTRSVRVSVGTGVIAVAIVALIGFRWPVQDRPLPVPAWANRESAVRLVAESRTGEFRRYEEWSPWNPSGGWQMGHARLRLSGIEEGWSPVVQLAEATVRFADGAVLTTAGNGYSSPVPFESNNDPSAQIVMRRVLGVQRVWEESQASEPEAMPAIVMSDAEFRKYSGASVTYQGRFVVSLDHLSIAATLPLQPGVEFQDRGRRLIVERVIQQTQVASVQVRQFTTATMFDSDSRPRLSFYLRNRRTAEAVAGSTHEGMPISAGVLFPLFFGFSAYSHVQASGLNATGDFIRFSAGFQREEQFEITAEWLSEADLVIVHTRAAGSVMRSVEIPDFEIRPAPPKSPR
jgi:hypothetical protein